MKFYPCEWCEGDLPCKDCAEEHCFIDSPCECCEYGGKDIIPPPKHKGKQTKKIKFKENSKEK